MRCPHCRHENRETARFCGECGASFERGAACPRCAAKNPVGQRFCDSCGERLATGEGRGPARDPRSYTPGQLVERILATRSALEGERKQVTVLFADVVDSMLLAERVGAEEWHRVLDRFFQIAAEAIHRFEGTVNQFTGDGIMALFGAPIAHEDNARLVEGFFTLHDQGARATKGVSTPVRVFELQGIGPLRARLDASGLRGFSRLVGRGGELAWLDHVLARATESDGQVVGVVGDAGVGKSRLCLEFVSRCRAQGIAVHEAHCPAHGSTVPMLPVRDLLRSYLALGDGDSAEAVRCKVSDQLLGLDPNFREALPLVLDLLGVPDPDTPDTSRASSGERLAAFVRRFVPLRSATEPVVLLIDDAHWIDPASEELVRELAAAVHGTRTLLLANFRPEYRPAWLGGSHYHQLPLSPLGPEATRELLHELLGSDSSVGDLSGRIRERTGGNPFFIEEVVQALAASGSLAGERGAYRLTGPVDTLALPATVQSLLAARIDRLGEQAKHVLQAAAVMGMQFDEPLLEEVGRPGAPDLDTALGRIREAEFIYLVTPYPQPQYAFKHPLTREVAYHSLLGDQRARLHAMVAAALEKLRADRLGQYASLIAHHWEASGMRYEATRWQRRAALQVSNIKVKSRRRVPTP